MFSLKNTRRCYQAQGFPHSDRAPQQVKTCFPIHLSNLGRWLFKGSRGSTSSITLRLVLMHSILYHSCLNTSFNTSSSSCLQKTQLVLVSCQRRPYVWFRLRSILFVSSTLWNWGVCEQSWWSSSNTQGAEGTCQRIQVENENSLYYRCILYR